jgi:hypothetical protein
VEGVEFAQANGLRLEVEGKTVDVTNVALVFAIAVR